MEWTYKEIAEWFDRYFRDVCRYQGDLDTVPRLRKYFAPDLELKMYTAPSSPPPKSMSLEDLLVSFVHPGLQEDITPNHLAIDVERMTVAVQFEIRFSDRPTATEWRPIEASAHYQLAVDENRDLKIARIQYWTEPLPEDLFGVWARRREEEFRRCALKSIHSGSRREED